MTRDIIEYVVLIIVLLILLLAYFIYIIYDDQKKINYYKKNLAYETDWDKYSNMVKRQRRIIMNKKMKLWYLRMLVFLKGLFKWK